MSLMVAFGLSRILPQEQWPNDEEIAKQNDLLFEEGQPRSSFATSIAATNYGAPLPIMQTESVTKPFTQTNFRDLLYKATVKIELRGNKINGNCSTSNGDAYENVIGINEYISSEDEEGIESDKLNVIGEIEEKSESKSNEVVFEVHEPKIEKGSRDFSINYNGRNLLDLGSNISGPWNFQPAKLPTGVDNFLGNRSQYSYLHGHYAPETVMKNCPADGCGFLVPQYV